jgi:hypothetical protein
MPKTTYHRTADDQQVDEQTALDHRGVIKSGFTMRTKLTMIDGVPVDRDPFVALTDEQKIADIDARNARLSDAWRNPTPFKQDAAHLNPPHAGRGTVDMDTVYERHDRRLQDAWRA